MKLNIPTQLSEVTLIQFMKYQEYLNANEELTAEQADKKAVSVFCNISMTDVNKIPIKDYKEIVNLLNAVIKEEPKELITTWSGLGFIPNLDKVSVIEYADLENYYTEDESKIDHFMAVLYRPISKKILKDYVIEDYNDELKHLDKIHQMPMDVCRSATGFFLTLREKLLLTTLKYSKAGAEPQTQQT